MYEFIPELKKTQNKILCVTQPVKSVFRGVRALFFAFRSNIENFLGALAVIVVYTGHE